MNITELKKILHRHSVLNISIVLSDGGTVPAHFHVTEAGHIARKFVDCGGKFRTSESCVLQTYLGSPRDDGHRLTAGKLAAILDLAKPILPSDDLPVEIEYEGELLSQFPVAGARVQENVLVLQLGLKHTDCLAREKCGLADGSGSDVEDQVGAASCCGASATACCS